MRNNPYCISQKKRYMQMIDYNAPNISNGIIHRTGGKFKAKMADFRQILIRILSRLEQAVFPAECLRRDAFIPSPEHALFRKDFCCQFRETFPDATDFGQIMAPLFCPDCASDVLPTDPPICRKCGVALRTSGKGKSLCNRCSASPPLFRMARAYGTYDNIA